MADGKVTMGVKLDPENVEKDAEKAGRKAGDSFGEGFDAGTSGGLGKAAAAIGKLTAAMAAAGAAATVAIGKQALEAYAQYEQLVGGVDTLFGESSAKLQAYADEAYKTAGMSANDYMSTVTSFSASLLQSLGGDTEAAADAANQALIDMADNANKMGTSMESIQLAYQGFAKQNYTMLDNLKLGYGGTKTEMERLLADATALSGVQYDISNLADVYEAIHVIQTEIGITGTTAAEAASTIEGSTATAQAAWQNWLVEIAKSDGDVAAATANLVESVGIAASNIVPRIGEIVASLGTFLMEQMPVLFDQIISSISENGVEIASAALDYFLKFVAAIAQATPDILIALLLMLASLVAAIYQKVTDFVAKGGELMIGVAQGIKEKASMVASEIGRGISEGVQRIKDKISEFIGSGRAIIEGLTEGIRQGFEKAKTAVSNGMAALRNFFPFSPAKEGPFSGKGWTLYSGRSVVEAFAKGMVQAEGTALSSVGGIMGDFQAALSPQLAYGGYSSTTTTYSFGDVHLNASDAYGITAIEQLIHLIETA